MRKYFTLWFSLLLAMMLTGAVAAQETVEADSEAYKEKDLFADCNREAPALQVLIDYFRTFYDDDVVKTGSFHRQEELADDRGDGRIPQMWILLTRIPEQNSIISMSFTAARMTRIPTNRLEAGKSAWRRQRRS